MPAPPTSARRKKAASPSRCASVLLLACATLQAHAAPPLAFQERQCMERGWERRVVPAGGLERVLLWKAPAQAWSKGAILVLHGGGGRHFQWCVANAPIVASQVRFSELAVKSGFA